MRSTAAGRRGHHAQLRYDGDQRWPPIADPDGGVMSYGYNAAGRVTPTFAYDAEPRHRKHARRQKVALTFDGAHATGATWSGTVAGSVARTLDTFLRATSRKVNGANIVSYCDNIT